MFQSFKTKLCAIIFSFLIVVGCIYLLPNFIEAAPPKYEQDFSSHLTNDGWVIDSQVSPDNTLRENIRLLFYPWAEGWNMIYNVVRNITLWVMIWFLVRIGASLLFSRWEEKAPGKMLRNLLYILLWWAFVYWANWLFGSVLSFSGAGPAAAWDWSGIELVWNTLLNEGWVFFVIMSAIKAAAFFLAIIMIVVTWFRVISAWEWEKWKKLVKWLINVVVALLIIKWIDFIYYLAADSANFIQNATIFILDVAKVFAYIYGAIILVMVFIAWYLYITDWWSWTGFKKASNILVNILLSALVLFAFLLILYQIFAEFGPDWDAISFLTNNLNYV